MTAAIRRLRHDQRGIALILALITLSTLSIVVVTVITFSASNGRSSSLSSSRQGAYTFAEAGLNNALSVLFASSTPLYPSLLPSTSKSYNGGTATWSGTLDQTQPNTQCPGHVACWMITATGAARNPTGAANQTRTLTVKVGVDPIYVQPLVNDAYDYVFVYGTGAVSGCDFSASNSSAFTSALYVQGNFCLSNSASVSEELHVWGTASINSPQSGIGTSSSSNTKGVHIKNGCRFSTNGSGSYHSPCTSVDHVWANPAADTNTITLSPPTIDWTGWYKNASPGPYQPCTTTSGTPNNTSNWTTAFDGDQGGTIDTTKLNRSVPSTFNLTPTTGYSCKTAFGELTWNPSSSPPLLTIKGTIYIDGNARIEPQSIPLVRYTGVGSLYLSGSFVIKGTNVCAAYSGSTCDWTKPSSGHWDVANNFLDVVAGGPTTLTGGVTQSDISSTAVSVALVSAGYQGAVTASNRVEVTSQSSFQGPLVERELVLGQSLTTYPFGKLTNVPTATPGNPIAAVQLVKPSSFGG